MEELAILVTMSNTHLLGEVRMRTATRALVVDDEGFTEIKQPFRLVEQIEPPPRDVEPGSKPERKVAFGLVPYFHLFQVKTIKVRAAAWIALEGEARTRLANIYHDARRGEMERYSGLTLATTMPRIEP